MPSWRRIVYIGSIRRREEVPVQREPEERPVLVEGVDYYIENGLWVFTAAHHLKRGFCCGSGCRHCPYGEAKTAEKDRGDDNSPK
jgi:hypothetical protein